MAHFVLEYSDNLGQDQDSIQTLFKCFAPGGSRNKAISFKRYSKSWLLL